MYWKDHAAARLAEGIHHIQVQKDRDAYVIDRLTTLEALQEVSLKIIKKVFGYAAARELEMP